MSEQENEVVAYVLDYPEEAAREIARLRACDPSTVWVVVSFMAGFLFGLWVS